LFITIRLAEKGSMVSLADYLSTHFVTDSVEKKQLQKKKKKKKKKIWRNISKYIYIYTK